MKITLLSISLFCIISSSKSQEVLKISGVSKSVSCFSHGFSPRVQIGDTLFLLVHPKGGDYNLTLSNTKGKVLATCIYRSTNLNQTSSVKAAPAHSNHGKPAATTINLIPAGEDCLKQYSASIK